MKKTFYSFLIVFNAFCACNTNRQTDFNSFVGKYKEIKCHFIQPGNRVSIDDNDYRQNKNMSIFQENNKFYIDSVNRIFNEKIPIIFVSNNYFVLDTSIIEQAYKTRIIYKGYGIIEENKIKIRITGLTIPIYSRDDQPSDNVYFPFDITSYYERINSTTKNK